MTLPTLYEIATEYRAITDALMDADLDEQTIADTLEGERWPLELKARNYAAVIGNLAATAEAIQAAEEQMAMRRKALERRVDWLKRQLKDGMELAGITRVESPHFVISIQNNSVESVEIDEPGLLPADYWRQPPPPPPEIDKAAIRTAIKSGFDVPGARLTRGTHLRIK